MRTFRATMPNAQVAIVILNQSVEDEVGGGFWRGTCTLDPASCPSDGVAGRQLGPRGGPSFPLCIEEVG